MMRKGSRPLRSRPRYEARDAKGRVVLTSWDRNLILGMAITYNTARGHLGTVNQLAVHDTHDADEAIVPLPA